MGQGLAGEVAAMEAERLLRMALILLDNSGNLAAAANVAHALDILAHEKPVNGAVMAEDVVFLPNWGNLVDRHASAG